MKNLFIIILLFTSLCLWAQNVPQTIDYQGRLADSDGNYLNVAVTVDFLIYDVETGGAALWSETHDASCANGIFHVQLGSSVTFPPDLFNSVEPWLELVVSGETLSPRTTIASVPYAIKAETAYTLQNMGSGSGLDADLLDGLNSTAFMPVATDNWVNTAGDTMTGELIVQSNVGIGTTTPSTELEVNGVITASGGNSTNWNTTFGWGNHAAAGYLTSSGTITGLVQSTTTGDSYFTGGKFGIGTINPVAKLHVNGDDGAVFIGTLNNGIIPIQGAGARMMWYPKKAAFRAGYVIGNQWDDINIGTYSTALGCVTIASGIASTALGYHTYAEAYASVALGRYNVGGGTYSWIITEPLFEIGIGTSESNRANALTVLKSGNVGIGIADPDTKLEIAGQIKITGGNPGEGKVLTSDANGLASWVGGGYTIGDFAQGGHVIEVSLDGNHGIIAALQDQSSSVNWFESNDVCNNAANHNPSGSNYRDWRLPTKRELNLLFEQKDAINSTASVNGGETFDTSLISGQYWSSTAHMDGGAWAQRFANGVQFFTIGIGTEYRVRVVRVF